MKQQFLQWLSKLSCHHKWDLHRRVKVFINKCDTLPVEIYETLICKECGKIKRIKV